MPLLLHKKGLEFNQTNSWNPDGENKMVEVKNEFTKLEKNHGNVCDFEKLLQPSLCKQDFKKNKFECSQPFSLLS